MCVLTRMNWQFSLVRSTEVLLKLENKSRGIEDSNFWLCLCVCRWITNWTLSSMCWLIYIGDHWRLLLLMMMMMTTKSQVIHWTSRLHRLGFLRESPVYRASYFVPDASPFEQACRRRHKKFAATLRATYGNMNSTWIRIRLKYVEEPFKHAQ